jgi:hypothetical protein
MSAKDADHYSEEETERRREVALKRMLATPHQPHKPIGKKKATPKARKPSGASAKR